MRSQRCSTLLRATMCCFKRPRIVSFTQGPWPAAQPAAQPVNNLNRTPQERSYETCTLCESPPDPEKYHCQRCQDAKYCSSECLETDEDAHSMVCGTFLNPPRCLLPDEQMHGLALVRGLIFEANANHPKFAWIGVKDDEPLGLGEFLSTPPIEAKFHTLCNDKPWNPVRHRRIRDEVKVYTQGPVQGMQDNQSIRQVIGTCRRWLEVEAQANVPRPVGQREGEHPLNEEAIKCCCTSKEQQPQTMEINGIKMHPWKGNIAFMVLEKSKVNNVRHFRDANSTDFRDIVDFLSICRGHQLANEDDTASKARARSLRIVNAFTERTRKGDLTKLARREHLVPKDHPLVRDQGTSSTWGRMLPISQCIDLPMYAVRQNNYLRSGEMLHRPDRHRSTWQTLILRSLIDPSYNSTLSSSNATIAPGSNEVALSAPISDELWAAGYENLNHISVVLVRADQKDLRRDDVGRLVRWIRVNVLPRLVESGPDAWNHRGNHPMFWTEERYAQLGITKASFHEFWHQKEEEELAELAAKDGSNPVKTRSCPYELK